MTTLTDLIKSAERKIADPTTTPRTVEREKAIVYYLTSMQAEIEIKDEAMRKLKQLFCRHRWEFVAKNSIVNEVLEQCTKCKVYNVWHRGINAEYKTKELPTNKGWPEVTE